MGKKFLNFLCFCDRYKDSFFYVSIALISISYVILAMQLPVTLRAHTFHDDYLFWVNGSHIYNGEWLGPYSQMTLAKGAGFPLFLALNAHIGFPVTLSIALFNLIAFIFVLYTLIRIGVHRIAALLAFIFILFNPYLFPTHILRDNIYPAVSLIVIFSFIHICIPNQRKLFFSFLSGIFAGYFWIIREEGIWLLPGLSIFFLFFLIIYIRQKNISFFKTSVINAGVFIFSAFLFVNLISVINYVNYKIYITVDFKEEYYKKSVNILNSIEPEKRISHVPVSEEQRKIAYSVSPTFAQLETYFEVTGKGWTTHLCNVYRWTCNDYAAGLFIWAYRDAVAELGHYKTADSASAFYKNVYMEISKACDDGRIRCNHNPFGFLPKLTQEQLSLIPASASNAMDYITFQVAQKFDAGPSTEPYDRLAFGKLFLRNPLSSPSLQEESARFEGWFYHKGDAWIKMECNTPDSKHYSKLIRQESPDILSGTNDPLATHQRFVISTNSAEDCLLSYEGKSVILQKVIDNGSGGFNLSPGSNLYFDKIVISDMTLLREKSSSLKSKVVKTYQIIAPFIIVLGLFCFILVSIVYISQKKYSVLFVAVLCLWILMFTRIVVLVLVDISSFPAIQADYIGPAFPLIGLASILSIALIIKPLTTLTKKLIRLNST